MNPTQFITEFADSRVVLVVRLGVVGVEGLLDRIARCASNAGVSFMEVTTNTPGGLEWVRSHSGDDPTMRLGVGTLTDVDSAATAIDAGADFIVSPHVDVRIADLAADASIAYVAGALTPTEVLAAHEAGSAAVKVFPVTQLGPGYIRDLRGPVPDIPLVAIGGVDEDNAADYIGAGATGVGVGNSFVSDSTVADGDWDRLTERLRALVARIGECR